MVPANLSSTLAKSASSVSPRLNPPRPGPASPPAANPASANFDGPWERLAYLPCSTTGTAGLKALSPLPPLPAERAAATGAGPASAGPGVRGGPAFLHGPGEP